MAWLSQFIILGFWAILKVYIRGCKAWIVKVDHYRILWKLLCWYICFILYIKHVVKRKMDRTQWNKKPNDFLPSTKKCVAKEGLCIWVRAPVCRLPVSLQMGMFLCSQLLWNGACFHADLLFLTHLFRHIWKLQIWWCQCCFCFFCHCSIS